MVILQTLAVYILLTGLMWLLLKDTDSKWVYVRLLFALIAYSLVFGYRYGVGRDYFAYLAVYNDVLNHLHYTTLEFEPGFMFILNTLTSLGISSTGFFFVIAFLQVGFIFFAQRDKTVFPYLAFTLMGCCVWLAYCNGLRQELAFCIFVYSLKFIEERHIIAHYALIALCISIHTSAWLLVIVYPLMVYRANWFKNILVQYALLVVALILMHVGVINQAIGYGENIAFNLGYENYLDMSDERYAEKLFLETSWGVGAYLILLLNILLLFWSNEVKAYNEDKRVQYFYNLFFIGILWNYIFNNSPIFGRVNYYMFGFQYIWAAYTLKYLYEQKRIYFYAMSLVIVGIFFGYMLKMYTNTALYIFNWQEDYFKLKMDFYYI